MARRRMRVRFLRGTDHPRDGRFEAGQEAAVNWPNLEQLAAWGVLEVLPETPEQRASERKEVRGDASHQRQGRQVL